MFRGWRPNPVADRNRGNPCLRVEAEWARLDGLRCLSLQGPLGPILAACRCDWDELADYRWLNSFSIDPSPIFNCSPNQCLTRLCVACAAGRLRNVAAQEIFSSFVVLATVLGVGLAFVHGFEEILGMPTRSFALRSSCGGFLEYLRWGSGRCCCHGPGLDVGWFVGALLGPKGQGFVSTFVWLCWRYLPAPAGTMAAEDCGISRADPPVFCALSCMNISQNCVFSTSSP